MHNVFFIAGAVLAVGFWWRKKRLFRQSQIVNVTEGRTRRASKRGGGF